MGCDKKKKRCRRLPSHSHQRVPQTDHTTPHTGSATDPLLQEIRAVKLHENSEESTFSSESRDSLAALPDTIAGYKIIGILGRGGMGIVYKGFHQHLKREVAIKVIRTSRSLQLSAIDRFRREIHAIGKLQHPNIVQAHDAGIVDGKPYLVLELLEGSDFSRYVKEHGPLSVSEACEVVRQTAQGLQHAHEAGLIHRDIKPSNLWRTPTGDVKILDLGLARFPERDSCETAVGCVVGSPGYLSPEQAQGSVTDKRSDMYSLGCTFYYLLQGKPPQYAGLNDLPSPVKPILENMLAEAPENRYQSMSELIVDLEQQRRKSGPWIAFTTVVLLLLAGMIASVFYSRQHENAGTTVHEIQTIPHGQENDYSRENWLTTKEIAEYLSVSEKTVYRWISEGKMPAHKVGRQWRFKKGDVDDWIKTRKTTINPNDPKDTKSD